jgi:hypothetical protein
MSWLSGLFNNFSGKTAADASTAAGNSAAAAIRPANYNIASRATTNAANDTYGKQQDAIGNLLSYGDQYKAGTDANAAGYNPYIQNYQPYVQTGQDANSALSRLMTIRVRFDLCPAINSPRRKDRAPLIGVQQRAALTPAAEP